MEINNVSNNTSSTNATTVNQKMIGATTAFAAAKSLIELLNNCLITNSDFLSLNVDAEKEILEPLRERQKNNLEIMQKPNVSDQEFRKAQEDMRYVEQEMGSLQKSYQTLFDLLNEQKNITSSSVQQMLQLMSTISQTQLFVGNLIR